MWIVSGDYWTFAHFKWKLMNSKCEMNENGKNRAKIDHFIHRILLFESILYNNKLSGSQQENAVNTKNAQPQPLNRIFVSHSNFRYSTFISLNSKPLSLSISTFLHIFSYFVAVAYSILGNIRYYYMPWLNKANTQSQFICIIK